MEIHANHRRGTLFLLLALVQKSLAFNCLAEYMSRISDLFTASGAQTTLLWRRQAEVWSSSKWFDPSLGEFLSQPVHGGDLNTLTQRFVHIAQGQFVACGTLGGSYWHTRILLNSYIASLWRNGSALAPLLMRALSSYLDPRNQGYLAKEGLFVGGVCAPADCKQEEVEREVVPQYVGHLLLAGKGIVEEVPHFPPPGFRQVSASQLVGWDHIKLNFVIAGVDRCGTTSLRMNLQQHPQVRLSNHGREDISILSEALQNRLLPLKSSVDRFNSQWGPLSSQQHDYLYGLAFPLLFSHSESYHALSLIPGIRIIVVVCDPVGRFENYFVHTRYCNRDMRPITRGRDVMTDQIQCDGSIGRVLEKGREWVFEEWNMGRHLHKMHHALGPAMIVFHQELMRFSSDHVFHELVTVLGLSQPFPEGTKFKRWNVRKGHRTDLCRNSSLLRALKKRLQPEYEVLEEILFARDGKVPATLFRRQTRCDRPEELLQGTADKGHEMDVRVQHVRWHDNQNMLRARPQTSALA